jgi:hypothetical protein
MIRRARDDDGQVVLTGATLTTSGTSCDQEVPWQGQDRAATTRGQQMG